MTNSPPEDPRNPIPERRRRPATGVTFDEMIGIIVAMTTIGAILFWSLGGKKGGLANNFGFGGGNNLLSSDTTTAATGFGIGKTRSDVKYDEDKPNRRKSERSRREESPVAKKSSLASSSSEKASSPEQNPNQYSTKKQKSSQFRSVAKLVPLAGVATLPALNNGKAGNADTGDGDKANPQGTSPDKSGDGDKAKPQATSPDKSGDGDKAKPQGTSPDKSGDGDKAKPQGTSPDKSGDGDKAKPQATSPDKSGDGDKAKPQATSPNKIGVPNDVKSSYWAYPFVKQMGDEGLVPDFADDQNFEPDKLITRAGMAKLIGQAFDTQPEIQGVKKFKDVADKNAIADIDTAVRTGFMQGYSDKEFRPEENIPRYQVLVALATGLGLKPSQDADQVLQKFGDGTDMPDWAKKQVAAAAEAGLIVNPPKVTKNSLKPNQSATRGEVAAMIHQALVKNGKLKPLKSEYILEL